MMGESDGDLGLNGSGVHDEAMTDVGEKGRPPGDPPDGSASWAQRVKGGCVGGRMSPESVLADEFVSERLHLSFPNGTDGEPEVTIEVEVLDAMNGLWKQCMVVKGLGRNISIPILSRKLREMWKPQGGMYVMDLPRQFFMIRFEVEEEYLAALTGGPWRAFGSYLMVQDWSPSFDPLKNDIVTTPVWVRLANIPVNFYHKSILMGIAKGLGKPIRLDTTTSNFERARFARICVEVNLNKPLKGTILVNKERYSVAYEGLSNICSMCGMYGHLIHTCPKVARERMIEELSVSKITDVSSSQQENVGFTEVRRRGKGSQSSAEGVAFAAGGSSVVLGRKLQEIPENITISNRFGELEEDTFAAKTREEVSMIAGNKENVDISQQLMRSASQGRGRSNTVNLGKVHSGLRENLQVRRAGANKPARPIESVGAKIKQSRVQRPVRGLVFGPISGEQERSESGKRLRVEGRNMGRYGGAFATTSHSTVVEENMHQVHGADKNIASSNTEVERMNTEMVMCREPPEGMVELINA